MVNINKPHNNFRKLSSVFINLAMSSISPKSSVNSPKTPGGISKSLLTPCRSVGLSRKWRKGGCSPFISPLSTQNATVERTALSEEMKRKKIDDKEHTEVYSEIRKDQFDGLHGSSVCSPMSTNNSNRNNDITSTPSRNTQIPRKNSKILSLSLKSCQETNEHELASEKELQPNKLFKLDKCKTNESNKIEDENVSRKSKPGLKNTQIVTEFKSEILTSEENVAKLPRTESKIKKLSLKKSLSKSDGNTMVQQSTKNSIDISKENNPNNLTKECIVVIQNRILKTDSRITSNETEKVIQESDLELDVPLSTLKRESIENVTLNTLDDDDFITKSVQKKPKKLSTKIKNETSLSLTQSSNTSQSSQETADRRTILVKKSYEKVTKPHKAKSTGSITQKDIDDLKVRIEFKKNLLLAKSMSTDTEELRGLIKKWQKGCQDALIELLDLMKKKLPDKQNMDYAEILENLKIPAELVGYDSENDCFITPDDTNVLLSAFKL